MNYGFCHISIVPVRTEPSDKSEICTQILFGELIRVIETYKGWCKVQLVYDNYKGWIDKKQFSPLSNDEFLLLNKSSLHTVNDLVQLISVNENEIVPIVLGSSLPGLSGNTFKVQNNTYTFEGFTRNFDKRTNHEEVIGNAHLYLNAPYLWGGRSPFGIDCSGFVQMVFKLSGIILARDANQQSEQGETINLIHEAQPCDLLFFENEEKKIIHTGILLSRSKIIHASGKVRIDTIDHNGIFNHDLNAYTHKLRLIKRIVQ